jgi:hypothetical protein
MNTTGLPQRVAAFRAKVSNHSLRLGKLAFSNFVASDFSACHQSFCECGIPWSAGSHLSCFPCNLRVCRQEKQTTFRLRILGCRISVMPQSQHTSATIRTSVTTTLGPCSRTPTNHLSRLRSRGMPLRLMYVLWLELKARYRPSYGQPALPKKTAAKEFSGFQTYLALQEWRQRDHQIDGHTECVLEFPAGPFLPFREGS